jgi:enoyl-CoA hydratase/carnithine racemase
MTKAEHYQTLIYAVDGAIATLTLNRPEKLNAINGAMIDELELALDRAEQNEAVRVIVLNGAGRAFSAGFDLNVGDGSTANDTDFWRRELQRDFNIIMRFWDCPKPTIAAVHNYCLGSAMEMAIACDLTLASEDCRFGAPEVRFGSGIVALILPWLTGVKAAKEMLLGGDDRIPAERALSLGFINRVVTNEQLMQETIKLAKTIACNDPLAVKLTKQAINRSLEIAGMRESLLQALELDVLIETTETDESKQFNTLLQTEGMQAALTWREKKLEG